MSWWQWLVAAPGPLLALYVVVSLLMGSGYPSDWWKK